MTLDTTINLTLAVANIILAGTSVLTARSAKKSVDAGNQTLVRMQDSLRPLVDLSLRIEGDQFKLEIRNVGVGPAKIEAFTTRFDVDISDTHFPVPCSRTPKTEEYSPIPSTYLAANEWRVFTLSKGTEYKGDVTSNHEFVSSMSVFYEDVYGRKFRSRLVFVYGWMTRNGERQRAIRTVLKESFALGTSYPTIQQSPYDVSKIEGNNKPVRYQHVLLQFHSMKLIEAVRKLPLDGVPFTQRKKFTVTDIFFTDFSGQYPCITVQVVGHTPFTIEVYDKGDDRPFELNTLPRDKNFSDFGLIAKGPQQDSQELSDFYRVIGKTFSTFYSDGKFTTEL